MKLRYDFGKNLDLSEFRKRFYFYLGSETSYSIFLYDFRIDITPSVNEEFLYVNIYDLIRDMEGDVTLSQIICPLVDNRLKYLDLIKNMFPDKDKYYATIDVSLVEGRDKIVKDICNLIKVLHKFSNLKVFL
jgi:hypothetical protein